jgi:L-alanine-DL-glutamate epimerase-like enolase superfamily enzyme
MMEEGNRAVDRYNDIFLDGWKPRPDFWDIPDQPGLGVDISPALLKEIRVA